MPSSGPRPRRSQRALLHLLLLLPTLLVSTPSLADAGEPRPFTARYQLEVKGWPDAVIDHRLVRDGQHWLNALRASLPLASGEERSRFTLNASEVVPLHYASRYALLGIGERFSLAPDVLRNRPDRLTALFILSRRAATADCTHDCRIDYLDHRGEPETRVFRRLPSTSLQLPAGDFQALSVELLDRAKPDRRLVLHFHPELPGLLLAADYRRDGQRHSRLTLTALRRPAP